MSDVRQRILEKFRSLAADRLAEMARMVTSLETNPGDEQVGAEVLREIHTVKGEAKMLGLGDASDAAHAVEDALFRVRDAGFQVSTELADVIHTGFDLIGDVVQERAGKKKVAAYRKRVDALGSAAPPEPVTEEQSDDDEEDTAADESGSGNDGNGTREVARPSPMRRDAYLRVHSDVVNHLGHLSADLKIRHRRAERVIEVADRVLERWEPDTPKEQSLHNELVDVFDRWRDDLFQQMLQVQDFQETVRDMRLVPLASLLDRYPRAVRELAREQNKQVRVMVDDGGIAVDKQVLDRIEDPMLHLVRNSVDHGLETPEERESQGKRPKGTIRFEARQVGSKVQIRVRDDGRGVDPQLVRATAIRRGLLSAQEADTLDNQAILAHLFDSGFSTRTEVTEVSGRGVGLDVVKDTVESLGGAVSMQSIPGQGTTFTLEVPISLALSQALVVRLGEELYALQSTAILGLMRIEPDAIRYAGDGPAVEFDEAVIPVADLGDLLGGLPATADDEGRISLVVVSHERRRLALKVAELVGERALVSQALDRFVAGLPLVNATAVMEGSQLVLFVNVPELVRGRGQFAPSRRGKDQPAGEPGGGSTVLVVEDSELTRDMVVGTLQRRGLRVLEAVNGRVALNEAAKITPDLILTDLDMPVMNGFELIAEMRATPELKDVPVVVFSTRGSDADKQQAMEVGANAYLVKSEYSEEELLGVLDLYLPHS